MPTYSYETEDGVVHDRIFKMGEAPAVIHVDSQVAFRSYRAEQVGVPATKGWPLTCCATGVHASQAGELRELLAKHGVPTDVTPDGDPVYRSADHRRKALKVRGFVDKQSYL